MFRKQSGFWVQSKNLLTGTAGCTLLFFGMGFGWRMGTITAENVKSGGNVIGDAIKARAQQRAFRREAEQTS